MQLYLSGFGDYFSDSFQEVHSLLIQAVGRWETFSVQGYARHPKALATWIPLVLPSVKDVSFDIPEWDRTGMTVISAPQLSRCVCDSENLIFRESSMMHEYSTAIRSGSHTLPSGQLISDLRTNCSALKILEIGDDHRSPAGSLEETPSTWPPLLQLQTLRFVRTTHKAINTLLTRLNAPNLKVVEVVGNSIYSDQTAVIPDTEPPTMKLAAGVNWRLRFKDSTPQDLLDTLERIKILPPPVVEIDLMGLISRGTLNDVFGNPDVSPEGENPLSPSERLQQHLKAGWERILDRLPSVIWVIEQCQGNWVPVAPSHPLSFQEGVEYILGVIAGRAA
ncbi:hypothetical protein FRC01_004899 [Tulasnella sp. 417]|nr:hypothetical protein FRC01_004899 [Tulasnella sp. 417]